MHTKRPGYMSINEAAAFYGVSRAKLHRLIRFGQLSTQKDPLDHRVTLLIDAELKTIFQFPANRVVDMDKSTDKPVDKELMPGTLTHILRTEVDLLRERLMDSMDKGVGNVIVRGDDAGSRRERHRYEAVFGEESNEEYQK